MKFNYELVEVIFSKVHLKLNVTSNNLTGDFLSFDQLKQEVKIYLIGCVLEEIHKYLIIELYYQSATLNYKFDSGKFFELILIKIKKNLEKEVFFDKRIKISEAEFNWLVKYLECETGELCSLIFYLVSFSSFSKGMFLLNGCDPYKILTGMLENLIIKISHVFVYLIILKIDVKNIIYQDALYANLELAKAQRNNFYWQAYLAQTFLKPKYIYYNLSSLKILTRYGISSKLVYLPNLVRKEQHMFSTLQLAVLFYFELFDVVSPTVFFILRKLKRSFFFSFN